MVMLSAFLIGAAIGGLRAKRRGGGLYDMLQYGAAHGILLALVALFAALALIQLDLI
ncbi:MAG: hypothetical protein AAGE18_06195 [Pseudomonadota bacterium]